MWAKSDLICLTLPKSNLIHTLKMKLTFLNQLMWMHFLSLLCLLTLRMQIKDRTKLAILTQFKIANQRIIITGLILQFNSKLQIKRCLNNLKLDINQLCLVVLTFHFKVMYLHKMLLWTLMASKASSSRLAISRWTKLKTWISYLKRTWSTIFLLFIAGPFLLTTQLLVVKVQYRAQTPKAHHRTFPTSPTLCLTLSIQNITDKLLIAVSTLHRWIILVPHKT